MWAVVFLSEDGTRRGPVERLKSYGCVPDADNENSTKRRRSEEENTNATSRKQRKKGERAQRK
jgi:hypothetical protein